MTSFITIAGLIILIIICFLTTRWILARRRLYRTFVRLGIPGPEPSFWLGNLRFADRDHVFTHMQTWFERYGDYFGYFRGDRPVLVVRDRAIIDEVFVKRFADFPNRLRFSMRVEPFSSSILALRDKRWRHVRRIMTPAFTAHKLSHSSVRKSISISLDHLLRVLRPESLASHIVIHDYDHTDLVNRNSSPNGIIINANIMSKAFTIDVISRIAFSLDRTDVFEPDSQLLEMVEQFMRDCDGPLIRLVFMFPFLRPLIEFINNRLTAGRAVDWLCAHLNRVLREYRIRENLEIPKSNDQHDDDNQDQEKQSNGGDSYRKNLLDYMLFQGKISNLSERETIGNLIVILFAGYETTACALAFTLFNLARYPDRQQRLRQELLDFASEKLRNENDAENEKAFDIRCEYLDRCILETLRLYPPVIDYVIREIASNNENHQHIQLGSCALKISPQIAIQVPVWTMHHDPDAWPEPYDFLPERANLFRRTEKRGQMNCADTSSAAGSFSSSSSSPIFAAFGLGQRRCIGEQLAMIELRSAIVSIVTRYRLELIDSYSYRYDPNRLLRVQCIAELIKPTHDIYLRLIPLN